VSRGWPLPFSPVPPRPRQGFCGISGFPCEKSLGGTGFFFDLVSLLLVIFNWRASFRSHLAVEKSRLFPPAPFFFFFEVRHKNKSNFFPEDLQVPKDVVFFFCLYWGVLTPQSNPPPPLPKPPHDLNTFFGIFSAFLRFPSRWKPLPAASPIVRNYSDVNQMTSSRHFQPPPEDSPVHGFPFKSGSCLFLCVIFSACRFLP